MGLSLNSKLARLPDSRRDLIHKRANELIDEEMTLRDLRLALKKTQQDLCNVLHIKQDGISRLEKRSDMLISTMNKYVAAMGGVLKITAEFPNRTPVSIKGFVALDKT